MELAQFQEALRRQTPRVWVTPALLAANVIVFGLMAAKGVNPISPTAESVIPWGADYGPKTLGGEWWRLLTACFIHFGVIHLAMNMFVLWGVGGLVERLYGNVPFLVLYLCAGLAGSVASTAWNPIRVSAGASGAVFGVYGALGAYLLRHRHVIPRDALRELAQGAGVFILYNILFGFSRRGIDNAAHLGGLAGGFIFGLLMAAPMGSSLGRRVAAAVVAVTLAAGMTFGILRAKATPADFFAEEATLREVYNDIDPLDQRVFARYNELAKEHASDDTMANVIDGEIVPEYAELRKRVEALPQSMPTVKKEFQPPEIAKYLRAKETGWTEVAQALRAHDDARFDRALRELGLERKR